MADPDKGWSEPRKLFVAALPGFVIAFFILQSQTNGAVTQQYAVLALVMLTNTSQRAAVRADHRRADRAGALGNAEAAEHFRCRERCAGAI
jgi:nitrite reductase (NADH) large subunit